MFNCFSSIMNNFIIISFNTNILLKLPIFAKFYTKYNLIGRIQRQYEQKLLITIKNTESYLETENNNLIIL